MKPKLEIAGCCRDCTITWPIKDGPAVTKLCPLHAAAPALLAACQAMLEAADELMTEFISKKRATDWGIVNGAMVDAANAIAKAKSK